MTRLAAALERGGVRLAVDGPVATVTLDRPDVLNAQTPWTWEALAAIGRALTGETRVVVLRGEGRAFSAGLDRGMFTPDGIPGLPSLFTLAHATEPEFDAAVAAYQEGFSWLWRPDLVSVAAVRGHAVGAGFQLALACDLRVAADDARFQMKEPALGLVPDLTGTKRLVDLVGPARAMDICLTARPVDAAEAYAMGLVSRVVPADGLDDAVAALVAGLLAVGREASIETKALLVGAPRRTQAEQQAAERAAQYRRFRAIAGLPTD